MHDTNKQIRAGLTQQSKKSGEIAKELVRQSANSNHGGRELRSDRPEKLNIEALCG